MKHIIIIAVSLLIITALSCTKKSSSSTTSSTDTTFNGSYFQISYNGKNFDVKGASINGGTISSVTEALNSTTIIFVGIPYGISGSMTVANGLNVGTDTIANPHNGTTVTSFTQINPMTTFSDTLGTVNVSHSGSDYIQGTFAITLYSNGLTYPATGSFKVIH